MSQESIYDKSYGLFPLIYKDFEWKICLVQQANGKHWGLPKGHIEQNESPFQGASRELLEETNLQVVKELKLPPQEEKYIFFMEEKKIIKTVVYFFALVKGIVKIDNEEIINASVLNFPDAKKKATFKESKNLLEKAERILKEFNYP